MNKYAGGNFEDFLKHYFFSDDLKAELEESSFRLLNSSVENGQVRCVLQRD